jgi:16S rRNA (uracil1498-N3)-methyltransferase
VRLFVAPGALAGLAGTRDTELRVTGDEHHYLARVRRARVGDPVELVDGAGTRAAAVVTALTEDAAVLRVAAPERIAPRPPFVRALVPPIKGDRMDACLEKLVEVGADEIVIWPAARAVVRWDEPRREARRARYEAALQAAARQCGRAQVPALAFADRLDDAIARAGGLGGGLGIVLDPAADGELARLPLGEATEVTVASGPEGGLSPGELERLARAGFAPVGLGPRVLRAETAPVVAVALIRAATQS